MRMEMKTTANSMSNRPVLLVDVDLTVVDSLSPWVEWYTNLTGHSIDEDIQSVSWNVENLMHNHDDPLSFWKKPDLYDNLTATAF